MSMSLEGKNTTEQLWKCSHLICWWTSARNLHESMRFKSPLRNNRRRWGWVPNKQTRLSPAQKTTFGDKRLSPSSLNMTTFWRRQVCRGSKLRTLTGQLLCLVVDVVPIPGRNVWSQFIHGSDSVHGVLNFWIKILSRNVSKFMWSQKSSLERDSADHETKNRNTSEDWTKIRFHQFPHLATCVLEDCNHTPYITKHTEKQHSKNDRFASQNMKQKIIKSTLPFSHSSQETAFRNSQKYRLPFFSWSTFPKISCKASRFSSVHSPAMPVSMASTSARCDEGAAFIVIMISQGSNNFQLLDLYLISACSIWFIWTIIFCNIMIYCVYMCKYYTSSAARGGAGSFKKLSIYKSEEKCAYRNCGWHVWSLRTSRNFDSGNLLCWTVSWVNCYLA